MRHAEFFVHAGGDGVDGGSTADFVIEFGGEFFTAFDDLLAFFAIWIPGVFSFCAGFLTESGKSDLREAVFNNFVTVLEFAFFPEAEFAGGFFDGLAYL